MQSGRSLPTFRRKVTFMDSSSKIIRNVKAQGTETVKKIENITFSTENCENRYLNDGIVKSE
jgi:hypothetical protein